MRQTVLWLVFLFSTGLGIQAQQLLWLGALKPEGSSAAYDVAHYQGQVVVVGQSAAIEAAQRAFRWTPPTGLQDLGTLSPLNVASSSAQGIDPTGTWIVGQSDAADGTSTVFLWHPDSGMIDLGNRDGPTKAQAVAADGSRVAGTVEAPHPRPASWTATTGWTFLLDNDWAGHTFDISADGQTIVGSFTYSPSNVVAAFRWTPTSGVEDLNVVFATTLPNTFVPSWLIEGRAISPDGRYIAGSGFNAQRMQNEPFLLDTQTPACSFLGLPSGTYAASALDVSADGTVVVGTALTNNPQQVGTAFWWTPQSGIQRLESAFANLLDPGSTLYEATAVSADGRYIAGYGYHATTGRVEAFLLDTQGTITSAQDVPRQAAFQWQCHPNPFSEQLYIELELAYTRRVHLGIYDNAGSEVAVLYNGVLPQGLYSFSWDGRNSQGQPAAAGVYVLRLRDEQQVQAQKVILLPR